MRKPVIAAALAAMLVPASVSAETSLNNKKALWHCQNNDSDRVAIDACTDLISNKAEVAEDDLAAAHFARGESLLNLRLDSLACEDFTAAIDLGMKTRRVFVRRAILFARRGKNNETRIDLEKALDDYNTALTIPEKPGGNMDDAFVYGSRAYVNFHLGKDGDVAGRFRYGFGSESQERRQLFCARLRLCQYERVSKGYC